MSDDNKKQNSKKNIEVKCTENQNISDANRAFQEKIDKQRGIPSGTNFESSHEYNEKFFQNVNSEPIDDIQENVKQEKRMSLQREHRDIVDYTKNQNIADSNRAFQEKVDKQRGLSVSKDSKPSNGYNNVFTQDMKVERTNDIQERLKKKETVSLHSQHPETMDYTKNQNISDANREFQEKVDKQRGIPSSMDRDSFEKNSANYPRIVKNGSTNDFQNNPVIDLRAPLHSQFRDTLVYTKNQSNSDINQTFQGKANQHRGIKTNNEQNSLEPTNSRKCKNSTFISTINQYRGIPSDKIRESGIDLSELYEKSARGGEKYSELAKTFGASDNDIVTLLETRNLKPRTNLTFKIGDNVKSVVNTSSTYLYESSTSNTDASQGIRMIKKYADPILFSILDSSMMSLDKAMKKDLPYTLNKLAAKYRVFGNNNEYISSPELMIDSVDLRLLKEEIAKKIEKPGNIKFNIKNSRILQQQIRGYLKANKDTLTNTEIGALNMLMQIARTDTIENSIIRRRKIFRTKMTMRSFRVLQQTDAGAGLFYIYNFMRRAKNTLTLGISAALKSTEVVRLAGKIAYKSSAVAAATFAKTKLGEKIESTKPVQQVSAIIEKQKKNKKEKKDNDKNKLSLVDRVKKFRNDPFGLRSRKYEYIGMLKNTKIGRKVDKILSPFTFVKKIAGHALAAVMSAMSFLVSVLMTVLGLLVGIILIVVLINSVIISLFDFSANDKEIQLAALEKIKTCYEYQNQTIEGFYNGQYANVSVTYKANKDDAEYAKEENQPYEAFRETTNSAEMLSMAQIYFDFDLEGAGKKKVVDYIEKLYNGSHLLTIIETPVYTKDEEGNSIYVETNVDATLETFYFNSIFDCQLMDQPNYANIGSNTAGTIIAGTTITPPEGLGTYYTYMGWQMITSKSSMQYKLKEKAGMNFDSEGFGIINGRYVIACTTTFGQVGDYIDFYLKNGKILKCIIGDIKRQTDKGANMWGHDSGKCMIEFVVDKTTWYRNGKGNHANPGTAKCHPEWKSSVTKAINGGNYFANPSGPVTGIVGNGKLLNPCPGATRISSEFGPRPSPGGGVGSTNHKGRDYAAPAGTPVLAAQSGTVKKVAYNTIRGNYVVIDHGNGLETWYQHFNKKAPVKVGQLVVAGQQVGSVGTTGASTGNHLHFEVHVNGKAVDPRTYL